MKKYFIPILFFSLFILVNASEKKEIVKAQKVVITEFGDPSFGLLIPDRGMADPHVWIENETLYVMCGHDKTWEPVNSWIMDRWEMWSTKDLVNWSHEYTLYPIQTYIGDKPQCWAGDLTKRNGKYYWFFSNCYFNTGVCIADKVTGPYKDLLGEPLLPSGIIDGSPYDPEIFVEDGVYTICFGAGVYYMATLAEDMKSIVTEPKAILVQNEKGETIAMDDKSTLFKRDDWYYLVAGGRYAMSKNLYGPYRYIGNFGVNGHNSIFKWKGQWYVIHENDDINPFYRGIGLQPLYFKEDGTIYLAQKRAVHPGEGENYNFTVSTMGWCALKGTTMEWNNKGFIEGVVSEYDAMIGSAVFLWNDMAKLKEISFDLTNDSDAQCASIGLATVKYEPWFWTVYSGEVKSEDCVFIDVPIKKGSQTISIPLSDFGNLNERLMQIRIKPTKNAVSGKWKIDNIILK